MRPPPVTFVWKSVDVQDQKTGEVLLQRAMVPANPYQQRAADKIFGAEGSEHVLVHHEDRNVEMHKACMAELNELYQNLPESVWYLTKTDGSFRLDERGEKIIRFPTVDHFRYWLLIEEGVCHEWVHEAKNERAAQATARNLRVRLVHARIRVDGDRVNVREAKSMKFHEMSQKEAADAWDKILARARSYVGLTKTVSRRNAGRAA